MYVITEHPIRLKQIGLVYGLAAGRVYGMSEIEGAKAIKQGATQVNKNGSPFKKYKKRGRPKKETAE